MTTTIGIIDHQPVLCESLAAALSEQIDLRVVGHASTAQHAAGLVEDVRPEVLVLGFDFAAHRGVDVLKQTRDLGSGPAIVMIMSSCDPKATARALRFGARGFVLTMSPVSDLVEAVRWVAKGQMWVSPPILTTLLRVTSGEGDAAAKGRLECLTRRELDVLGLLVEGLGHSAISARLHVSSNTVRTHSQNLQKKLGVRSAVAAVSVALEAGMRPAECEV